MKDGHQNISFDRWLMRAKDVLQLATTVGALMYGGFKFINKIDQMNATIVSLQREITELRVSMTDKKPKRRYRESD